MNGAITLQVRSQNATTLSPRRFLWASMALFDDDAARDTASVYRPLHLELHAVTEVRARILRILAQMSDGAPLEHMRPELQAVADNEPGRALWRRSAWSSTLPRQPERFPRLVPLRAWIALRPTDHSGSAPGAAIDIDL
jgi:hypothetical protein